MLKKILYIFIYILIQILLLYIIKDYEYFKIITVVISTLNGIVIAGLILYKRKNK